MKGRSKQCKTKAQSIAGWSRRPSNRLDRELKLSRHASARNKARLGSNAKRQQPKGGAAEPDSQEQVAGAKSLYLY